MPSGGARPGTGGARVGSGRKPYKPTDEDRHDVAIFASCGLPQAEMCRRIINPTTGEPISIRTLAKKFAEELKAGTDIANGMVAHSLFNKALGDGAQAVTAAIWWEKTRAGKHEIIVNEHSGPAGAPIQTASQVTTMTAEEYALARKAAREAV